MLRGIVGVGGTSMENVKKFLVVIALIHLFFWGVMVTIRGMIWNLNLMYDLVIYQEYIQYYRAGVLPYFDVQIDDYPPMFLWYLGLFTPVESNILLSLCMGLVNLFCILLVIYMLYKLTGYNYVYTLFLFSSYLFFSVRYEPIVVFLTVLSIYVYNKDWRVSAVLAAFAISFKWFFGFFIIALIMRDFKRGVKYGALAFCVYVLLNAPVIVYAFDNFIHPFVWHGSRVPLNDGIYNYFLVHLQPLPYAYLFPGLLIVGMIIIYKRELSIMSTYILIVLWFLLVSKVYSPQFNLWIVFFLIMYPQTRLYTITLEFLNVLIFPFLYEYVFLVQYEPIYLHLVLLRHINLLILFLIIYHCGNKYEQKTGSLGVASLDGNV